jgi:hypothetical protein
VNREQNERRKMRNTGFVTAAVIAACVAAASQVIAQKQLELRVPAYVLTPSAEVTLTLFVDPHPDNRTLVVEADSDNMFTSSQIPLEGGAEKRVHQVRFKGLAPGAYTIRATLRSARGVRAVTSNRLLVADF